MKIRTREFGINYRRRCSVVETDDRAVTKFSEKENEVWQKSENQGEKLGTSKTRNGGEILNFDWFMVS